MLSMPVTFTVLVSPSPSPSFHVIVTLTSLWLGGQITLGVQVKVPPAVPQGPPPPTPPPLRAAAGTATTATNPTTPSRYANERFRFMRAFPSSFGGPCRPPSYETAQRAGSW